MVKHLKGDGSLVKSKLRNESNEAEMVELEPIYSKITESAEIKESAQHTQPDAVVTLHAEESNEVDELNHDVLELQSAGLSV